MTKYYTIPGYGGSGDGHWQSYFDSTLKNCTRIVQDSYTEPVLDNWVERINDSLKNEDLEETILITHSLGGIALAHWAKKYGKTIKAALIVAPPDLENPYQDIGVASFLPIPKQPLPFPSVLVASTNDHWMTAERAEYFASLWGSEYVLLENAGHINAESGHNEWDEGIALLEKCSQKVTV